MVGIDTLMFDATFFGATFILVRPSAHACDPTIPYLLIDRAIHLD